MATSYRDGYAVPGEPTAPPNTTVSLTADNQLVDPRPYSILYLQSDNATAANRTFLLVDGALTGQELFLEFISGSSKTAQLANSGNCKLLAAWEPLQYDTLTLVWDGTYWVEKARNGITAGGNIVNAGIAAAAAISFSKLAALTSGNIIVGSVATVPTSVTMSGDATIVASGALTIAALAVTNAKVSATAAIAFTKLATMSTGNLLIGDGTSPVSVALSGDATVVAAGTLSLTPYIHNRSATLSLTSTNLLALFGTPVDIIAAPGAGKVIVPLLIEFLHTYSTTAYTNGGGGHIIFEWGDGTDCVLVNATRLTDASSSNLEITPSFSDVAATGTGAGIDYTNMVNQSFRISKQTAELAAGHALNIAKVRVTYRVVTVLA